MYHLTRSTMKSLRLLSSSDRYQRFIRYSYFLLFTVFLLPSFQLGTIFSHSLGKMAVALLFVIWSLSQLALNKPLISDRLKLLGYTSLFFFLSQSISVLAAQDLPLFIDRYSDLIIVFLFFFLSLHILDGAEFPKRALTGVLIFGTAIITLIKISLLLQPSIMVQILASFLHPGYIEIIEYNLSRGRIYLESYEEIVIPILFFLVTQKNNQRFPLILFVIVIQFFTFASNFRTKILMSIVAYAGSLFLSFRKIWINSVILLLIFGTAYSSLIFLKYTMGATIVDRLLLTSQYEDISSINVRFEQAKQALEVASSSPFFGIGLGQYILYTDNSPSLGLFIKGDQGHNLLREAQIPHNIFFHTVSETGFIGLFAIIALFVYFLWHDLKVLRSKHELTSYLIVSFWTLVIYSLFNPTYNFSYMILFWTLRAFIANGKDIHTLIK